ncbi:MAG: S8 family peptidase [Sphingobium sp.]|uniref:S8 family peptidase n=1 Tax=Sphingobium sp. TaxID=1912891 RepID=UPI0029ADA653|nr:S8 family peptidase [Sphingobium sp.]MDX3909945.1 S8 family peptidase [Sphingobium sp.]
MSRSFSGLWRRAALMLCAASVSSAAYAEKVARPRLNSLEYRLSWGAGAVRADGAYRKGATGAGVTVAMIDTGLELSSGLFAHLSPASIDLVQREKPDDGGSNHGRQTASLIAGALDGKGTFGLAYDATLLSIRADRDGSCQRICSFDPAVLANAIDYAVEHRARVIGLPLSSYRRLPVIEQALERAVASGALIVAAAGNNGDEEPVWPARYATDARFANAMIVAGASTPQGRLAGWSNKAGAAAERYLLAPGQNVIVDCSTRYCSLVSGTSYSVSYIAGAAALMMGQYPELSSSEVAALLLDGARDLRSNGTDLESGRGILDVARSLRLAAR